VKDELKKLGFARQYNQIRQAMEASGFEILL
jgi:hypothetical protein